MCTRYSGKDIHTYRERRSNQSTEIFNKSIYTRIGILPLALYNLKSQRKLSALSHILPFNPSSISLFLASHFPTVFPFQGFTLIFYPSLVLFSYISASTVFPFVSAMRNFQFLLCSFSFCTFPTTAL